MAKARQISWPIPYLKALDGQFVDGSTIHIRGVPTGPTFHVNLTGGPHPETETGDDLNFHLSCRLKEKVYVVNARWGGQWGPEERHDLKGKFELEQDQEFVLDIVAKGNEFKINLNGKELATSKFRTKLESHSYLYIDGTVVLQAVAIKNFTVPYEQEVSLRPGSMLYLSGEVDGWFSKRFELNFKAGQDYALHFNPRFGDDVIVRNHSVGGQWGTEEREGSWEFKKGKPFDVIVKCAEHGYELFTNGHRLGMFAHRLPMNTVTSIHVDGDIKIDALEFVPNM